MTTGEVIALIKAFGGGGGSSGGGVLVVGVSPQSAAKNGETKGGAQTVLVCDKTAGEIWTAAQTGIVIFVYPDDSMQILVADEHYEGSGYSFYIGISGQSFSAAAATDYPTA